MDDRARAPELLAEVYRCPGEARPIDRATHLGRLATFYPPCRQCDHREETHNLTSLQVRHWAEIERRGASEPRFTGEALQNESRHDVDREVARQFAAALAAVLWRDPARVAAPAVLVGSDGHWTSAEPMAAACEALQWAGCRTLEAGAVTSASLAAAAHQANADAALVVGNSTGEPHATALKAWGKTGRPWSLPGGLDAIARMYGSRVDRPRRHGGHLQRADARSVYLAPLEPMFHGLRPLRFVLDTRSEPFLRQLHELGARAACEVLRPESSETSASGAERPFVLRRLEIVGRRVVEHATHFGLWISGDGEACRLVDERGKSVPGEALFMMLAKYICGQKPGATLIVEREIHSSLARELKLLDARTLRADSTRQATSEAIERTGAVFGGGTSGRFWYAGQPAAPDALMTLALVLTILSQSDRPLSEVLDAA